MTTSIAPRNNDPADVLRAAVTTLRCHHQHPCQPPEGSVARPGPCTRCGTPYDHREPVPGWLREQLAALLDQTFNRWDAEMNRDIPECPSCDGGVPCHHDEITFHDGGCDRGFEWTTDRCDCFDTALAVARLIRPGGDAG